MMDAFDLIMLAWERNPTAAQAADLELMRATEVMPMCPYCGAWPCECNDEDATA